MIQAIQAQNLQVENSIHVEENSDQDPSVWHLNILNSDQHPVLFIQQILCVLANQVPWNFRTIPGFQLHWKKGGGRDGERGVVGGEAPGTGGARTLDKLERCHWTRRSCWERTVVFVYSIHKMIFRFLGHAAWNNDSRYDDRT